ncbi:hypothetical protein HNQ77_003518 [Silvibacterium bohemicum]|uniref:Uncharacterized protein n=1 Tax=Silvibacterium bohemicum TaxID=1577686 RepID=A0A841JYR9_9BACT|nr:hypothetical protein [Silvibacterium bohemicum]MBB6145557.1 hypothetical protein [Silvibacterium bohemicum]
MEIKVRLQLLNSEDSNGVKLWTIAEDGSGRRWFKRYENADIAIGDAEKMGLVEDTQVSNSGSRYALNVRRKLYSRLEMAEEALAIHWHSAAPAVSEEFIAKVLKLLPDHSTMEELKQAGDLKDLPTDDIRGALRILGERGLVKSEELFGRDIQPQDEV